MRLCPRCRFENDDLRKKCASCGKALGRGSAGLTATAGAGRSGSEVGQMVQLRPADRQKVVNLLREARKIEAIKAHRDATGLGLKESKEAVEALARQLGIEVPTGGGLGVVLGVLVLLAVLGFMFLA